MARIATKAPQEKAQGYSTRLYADTIIDIKVLTAGVNAITGTKNGERMIIEEAIQLYKQAHPEVMEAAAKLQAVANEIKGGE